MTCDCQCCTSEPPRPCARELLLGKHDAMLAERVARFVGDGTGIRSSSSPAVYADRAQECEPTESLRCRCGRLVEVLAFVADVVRRNHFNIDCEACR